MKKVTKIIWGVAIILVGLLVALYQLKIVNVDLFFDGWWTLFIVVPCVVGLCRKENIAGNLIGIAIGVVLLLIAQGVLTFSTVWKLWLPILLVGIGLSVIFSGKDKPDYSKEIEKVKAEAKKEPEDGGKRLNGFAAFSGTNYKASGERIGGGELVAVFGGLKYDLQKAEFTEKTVIDVCAVFGGVDLCLPENAVVKIKPFCIFGGVTDKRKTQPTEETEGAPVVYINAFSMFGGVTVK